MSHTYAREEPIMTAELATGISYSRIDVGTRVCRRRDWSVEYKGWPEIPEVFNQMYGHVLT